MTKHHHHAKPVRHHVREHSRRGYHVRDYERGSGSHVHHYEGSYDGKLSYAERERLPDKDFAVILADGTRKYPIENVSHARNALARVSRFGSPEEKEAVCKAVARRYPEIHEKHCRIHEHKDPVVTVKRPGGGTSTRKYTNLESAELYADKMEAKGYEVDVKPTFGENVGHAFKSGISFLRGSKDE